MMKEKSPDRELKSLKIENQKLKERLDNKDMMILKLSKDNANLVKAISKLKSQNGSSANNSTDHTHYEGSKDEKGQEFTKAPLPKKLKHRRGSQHDRIPTEGMGEYCLGEQSKDSLVHYLVDPRGRKDRKSRANKANKANSPYVSIQNRVSIDRNYRDDSVSSHQHGRSNSSLAIIRPAKNIDSEIYQYSSTAEKPKKKFRKTFLEIGVKKTKNFENEGYKTFVKAPIPERQTYLKEKNHYEKEKQPEPETPKKRSLCKMRTTDENVEHRTEEKQGSLYDERVNFRNHKKFIESTPQTKKAKRGLRQSMDQDRKFNFKTRNSKILVYS